MIVLPKNEVLAAMSALDYYYFWNKISSLRDAGVKNIRSECFGDGNAQVETFLVNTDEGSLIVQFEGTYSSWDSPTWDEAYLAEPYEFKEIRYRKVAN